MANLYWPVYLNLERSINDLSFAIHIDDTQLGVYSSSITDLILRAAAELESLSKDLYKIHGGTKTGELRYDDDAIKHLKQLWVLDRKEVIISSPNCFQTQRVLLPFVKNEIRTNSNKQTYSWNNAYQNLKHDRRNSFSYGSLKYLFDIMAALYLLNIYYRAERFELGEDGTGSRFPVGLGSSIFSIRVHPYSSSGGEGMAMYTKKSDFDESTYYIHYVQETRDELSAAFGAITSSFIENLRKHPKISSHPRRDELMSNIMSAKDVIGDGDYFAIARASVGPKSPLHVVCKYEGLLNTNPVFTTSLPSVQ